MRAIVVAQPGGPGVMRLADVPDPEVHDGEVLIEVSAAGVNRADVLQRMGFYPPPPGASDVLGLEVSGVVQRTSPSVTAWRPGDRVMALIEGGGYAELVCAPAGQVVPAPASLDLVSAAAIPEVFITAHDSLFTRGRLQRGESVLIHGGAGGVGTAAVQLARDADCAVIVTAGSSVKLQRSLELGAAWAIDHTREDFVARARDITGGRGVDVILDVMGAAYLQRNVDALAMDGRLVVIGLQGGTSAEIDLARLSRKRASLIVPTLRARPAAQKAEIVAAFAADVLPRFEHARLRPVIDRVLPLADAAAAHRAVESGETIGKVLLRVRS